MLTFCKYCNNLTETHPKRVIACKAYAWCMLLSWTIFFCWIPFCMHNLKNVENVCMSCKRVKSIIKC